LLREDNADLRLTEKAREIGLVDDQQWKIFCEKQEGIKRDKKRLSSTWVQASGEQAEKFNALMDKPLQREYSLNDLLKRPNISYKDIEVITGNSDENDQVKEQVEIQVKYDGYITRQLEEVERLKRYENTLIPENFNYSDISGLSNEVTAKLIQAKPDTLGRASRIPGVTPAAVSLLLVFMKKRGLLKKVKLAG
jgi:tRNA uridine 5-carboxymethylaminomethyl modification enzyme